MGVAEESRRSPHDGTAATVTVCMPVFNDWAAAETVIDEVRNDLAPTDPRFLVVDDGSSSPRPASIIAPDVEVLRLRRNVGHQRAIAIGLATLAARGACGPVVVMDADGEDRPADVAVLLAAAEQQSTPALVFAQRTKRSENLRFRLGYHGFRIVHRVLTGRRVDIGNFSVIPPELLRNVTAVSEIWVHYAAGVTHARIPVAKVPAPRGTRLAGRSSMNTVALVGHGLGALSIFGDEIVVRLLVAAAFVVLMALVLSGIGLATSSTFVGLVAITFLAFSVALLSQAVLGAVMLYRLKSSVPFVPLDRAAQWVESDDLG